MAEEEKNEQTEPEAPAEEAPAEEAPAAEAEAAPKAEAPVEPEAAEEEPAEQLSPKQRRKLARARADGPGTGPRSLEDRLRERAEERGRKAQARSRWRAKQREKSRAAPSRSTGAQQDEAAAARESAPRKTRQGIVVSSKADKTITVRIDRVARHRVYGKVLRETGTLHAHDEQNEANEGDVVRVAESRPLSRTKRWRLVEVLEKAR